MRTSIPVTVNLDFDQIQAVVDQMPDTDRERLAIYLNRQNIVNRIERFQASVKNFTLSDDEIQDEVKAARRERYAKNCC